MTISPKEWERIQQLIDSRVESGIDTGLQLARSTCPIKVFSEDEVLCMIHGLSSHTVPMGKKFLERILDTRGMPGFDRFMQRMNHALQTHREITLDDLDAVEKELLKTTSSGLSRRRLGSLIIGAFSAGAIAKHTISGVNEAYNPTDETTEHVAVPLVHQTDSYLDEVSPVIEVGLGTIGAVAAVHEYQADRMKQVAEAISKLSQQVRHDALSKHNSR